MVPSKSSTWPCLWWCLECPHTSWFKLLSGSLSTGSLKSFCIPPPSNGPEYSKYTLLTMKRDYFSPPVCFFYKFCWLPEMSGGCNTLVQNWNMFLTASWHISTLITESLLHWVERPSWVLCIIPLLSQIICIKRTWLSKSLSSHSKWLRYSQKVS